MSGAGNCAVVLRKEGEFVGADAEELFRRGKALVEMMGEFHSRMDMTL